MRYLILLAVVVVGGAVAASVIHAIREEKSRQQLAEHIRGFEDLRRKAEEIKKESLRAVPQSVRDRVGHPDTWFETDPLVLEALRTFKTEFADTERILVDMMESEAIAILGDPGNVFEIFGTRTLTWYYSTAILGKNYLRTFRVESTNGRITSIAR